ncbi:MAG: hypothetical protein QWI36_03630 [Wolbachia endosymbiont of Tyrophagus putrescentiae]|nr:hypothetical protein [Wolbachia endosymbiont of Tyrophagus putrescentiae]
MFNILSIDISYSIDIVVLFVGPFHNETHVVGEGLGCFLALE